MSRLSEADKEKSFLYFFYFVVLVSSALILIQCVWGDIPFGASGQPRSAKIGPAWSVPAWLIGLYLLSILSLLISPCYPLVGGVAYLWVTFLPAVHTPPWIYTQFIGLRTWIAMLAVSGAFLYQYRMRRKFWIFNDRISIIFFAFLIWYVISAAAAYLKNGLYNPPLQFHPAQLAEAMALYVVLLINGNRYKSLMIITLTMVCIVAIRSVWIQSWLLRDADIAGITVIITPLVFWGVTYFKQFWGKVCCFAVGCTGIWFVVYIQNRGAALGLFLSLAAFWITSQKKRITAILGIPMMAGGIFAIYYSKLGQRFLNIGSLQTIFNENPRVITWKGGLEMGLDNFFMGVGPGNFLYKIGDYADKVRFHSAHNIIVDTFAEAGILGCILYLTLISAVLIRCYQEAENKCTASRFIFVSIFANIGVGMFLSQTLMVLPYILFAIPVMQKK